MSPLSTCSCSPVHSMGQLYMVRTQKDQQVATICICHTQAAHGHISHTLSEAKCCCSVDDCCCYRDANQDTSCKPPNLYALE